MSEMEPRIRASPWPQEHHPAPAPANLSPGNPPTISRFPPHHAEQFRSEPQGYWSPITSAPALNNAHRDYHSARTAHIADPLTSLQQHAPITSRDGPRSPPQDVQYPSMRPRLGSTSDSVTVSSWQPSEASAWPPAREVPHGQAHDIEHPAPAPPSTFDIDDLAAQVIHKLNLGGGHDGHDSPSPRPTMFDVRAAIISHMDDQQHGNVNGRRTSNQARGGQRIGDEYMDKTLNANITSPLPNSQGLGGQCASDVYGDYHRHIAMSSQHMNNQGAGSQHTRDGYTDEPRLFNANISNANHGARNQRTRDGYMNESRRPNNISNANTQGMGSQHMAEGYMNESRHFNNVSNANNHSVGSQSMAEGYMNESRLFHTNIPNANGGASSQRPSYEYPSGPRHASVDDRRMSVVGEHWHSVTNNQHVDLQDQPARPASPTQPSRAGVARTAAQPESQAGQQDSQGGGRSAAAKRRQRRQRQKMRQNEDQEMEDVF